MAFREAGKLNRGGFFVRNKVAVGEPVAGLNLSFFLPSMLVQRRLSDAILFYNIIVILVQLGEQLLLNFLTSAS